MQAYACAGRLPVVERLGAPDRTAHPATVRKLAAQRVIPVHQDGPGCRLYFGRAELDVWRRSAPSPGASSPALRAVR